MKKQRYTARRLSVEELEGRLVPSTTVVSTNWSGYAVQAANVTAVRGSWVVPTVTGTGTSFSAAWVGIDGFNSSSVEQIGTDSDIVNGHPTYYAWFEMYPSLPVNLSLSINPGDTIAASVYYSSSNFTLNITDGAQSFSKTLSDPSAKRSSAEWVQEAPSSSSGVLPLANFGTIKFSNAQTTVGTTTGPIDNPPWLSGTTAINMVNSRTGATQASTSGLSDSGASSSFTVSAVGTSTGGGGGGHHRRSADQGVTQPSNLTNAIVPMPTQVFLPGSFEHVVTGTISSSASLLSGPVGQGGGLQSLTSALGGSGGGVSLADANPQPVAPPEKPEEPMVIPEMAPAAERASEQQSREQMGSGTTEAAEEEAGHLVLAPLEESVALLDQNNSEERVFESAPSLAVALALGGTWGLATEHRPERKQVRK
jgi:hypothetical protein